MRCFFCGSDQSAVVDKRVVKSSGDIRRRRKCLKCDYRYTTYEKISAFELYVIKRNGRREIFDRNKLQAGIEKALEKRPAVETIDAIVDKVITRLKIKGRKEIDSRVVGKAVLVELKRIDQVAYIRFASVYRQFNDLVDFKKELANIGVD